MATEVVAPEEVGQGLGRKQALASRAALELAGVMVEDMVMAIAICPAQGKGITAAHARATVRMIPFGM